MKLLSLVLVVLLASSVAADDFLYTKSDYSGQMRRKLGYAQSNIGALTDADAEAFVNEGFAFAMPLVRASKRERTFTTSYRVGEYALDSTTLGVISVWWKKADTLKILKYKKMSEWDEVEHKSTIGQSDGYLKRPSYYDYSDSLLYVYPCPSIVGDTIRVLAWHDIGDIVARDTLGIIPQSYRLVILNYATWAAACAKSDTRSQMFYEVMTLSVGALNSALNRIESK